MVKVAEKDSEILNTLFGRVLINEHFTDWVLLKNAIEESACRFIRVKIENFTPEKYASLSIIKNKMHLLEILQAHQTSNLYEFSNVTADKNMTTKVLTDKHQLRELILTTYTDIALGNYFPMHLANQLPLAKQLDCLIEYFTEHYLGSDENKNVHLYYDNNALVGFTITEKYYTSENDNGIFPNYVAVLPAHRNKGYQYKLCTILKQMAIEQKLAYVQGSVRISNIFSANAFRKAGYKAYKNDWIFLIEK